MKVSMTREEAINTLKNGLWWDRKRLDEAIDVAICALRPISRERVERMSGEWVHEPNKRFSLFYCSSCGETFEIHSYEVKKYGFCPYCGIPMTDKAVDMVMERLEALHETVE